MAEILVLYKSKYGSTEKYVSMLSEELQAHGHGVTVAEFGKIKIEDKYDYIIYGAGVRAYEMYSYKKFAKKVKKIGIKADVIVFAVGMMKATVPYAKRLLENNSVDSEYKFFYLRGAIDIPKLKGFDASIIKHMVSTLMLRDDLTDDEKSFISACLNSHDWVKKDNIMPIVEYIEE